MHGNIGAMHEHRRMSRVKKVSAMDEIVLGQMWRPP